MAIARNRLLSSAALLALAASVAFPCAAEPAEGAANEFGRWRTAYPGDFVPLNAPVHRSATAGDLADEADVIGVVMGGEARAYPLRLMTYHHVANDVIGGEAVAVTYCVMANTAVVFRRATPDVRFEAGGLYGGVLALREIGTESCWAQIATVPLPEETPTAGELTIAAPSVITKWAHWRKAHPDTLLLQPHPDYQIRYEAFDRRSSGFVANTLMNETIVHHDDRLAPGVEVFGLASGDEAVAFPLEVIREAGRVEAMLGGRTVDVRWHPVLQTAVVEGEFDGFAIRSFWYAWSQFHPGTVLP